MRLVVVGTGLMGGSFALAARQRGVFDHVVGVEPDPGRRRRALELGVVDEMADTVPDADAVLLAGPSHTIAGWVATLAAHPGVVMDTGSVKAGVLDAVRAASGSLPPRFVPCHPLAGSERSGPEAADAALYDGAEVILTPAAETDAGAVSRATGWWQDVGAVVSTMDARDHDRVLAVTSHLPHLVAFAFLQQVRDAHLPHAAGGFRDFTRIGAAEASMWTPIFQLNRTALLDALDDLEGALTEVRALIEAGDEAGLNRFIETAAQRRRRFRHD